MKSLLLAVILLYPLGAAASELPPGCVPQRGPGGCSGKSLIQKLGVWPPVSCLEVSINNCNGGMLSVQNGCGDGVSIGSVVAPPDKLVFVELFREGTMKRTEARKLDGNYARFSPAKDTKLSIKGKAGKTAFRLTYHKTKPLCP